MLRLNLKKSRRSTDDTVVGLEIEPSHIAAAHVHVNGTLSVDKAAVTMLQPRMLRDGEPEDIDALATAIRTMLDDAGMSRRVRLGLAHQRVVVRTIDLPPVDDPKALEAAVHAQARDHIPMPMDQAVLDYRSLGAVETPAGPRTRVVVVAVRRETVERYAAVAKAAGLELVGIDLSAFAMLRSLDTDDGAEAALIVNVAGTTNVAVAAGRTCLFTRTTPIGVEGLAEGLAQRCALTLEHARQWMTHVGVETPLEEVSGDAAVVEATRAVLDEGVHAIADGVRNSLNFYRTQEHAVRVDRIVVSGPAVSIPGFVAELGASLRMPVTSAVVNADESVDVDLTRLAVAAGLAIDER
jgi:type IV pilus assembly protein PilM